MKPIAPFFCGSLLCVFSAMSGLTARGASHTVTSPDGHTVAMVILDESAGTLSYQVTGRNVSIIDKSPLGIATDLADSGLLCHLKGVRNLEQLLTWPGVGSAFEGHIIEEILLGLAAVESIS